MNWMIICTQAGAECDAKQGWFGRLDQALTESAGIHAAMGGPLLVPFKFQVISRRSSLRVAFYLINIWKKISASKYTLCLFYNLHILKMKWCTNKQKHAPCTIMSVPIFSLTRAFIERKGFYNDCPDEGVANFPLGVIIFHCPSHMKTKSKIFLSVLLCKTNSILNITLDETKHELVW